MNNILKEYQGDIDMFIEHVSIYMTPFTDDSKSIYIFSFDRFDMVVTQSEGIAFEDPVVISISTKELFKLK